MNKTMRDSLLFTYVLALLLSGNAVAVLDPATEDDYELKLLGKYAFFDKISIPRRMGCVTCHDPAAGGTPGRAIGSGVNLHQVAITGADPHAIGGIAVPSNIYASLSPPLHVCGDGGIGVCDGAGIDGNGDCVGVRTRYCGGNFWDGRAEGFLPPALLPGATKHLGDEVFYKDASLDTSLTPYAAYFGPTADQALNPMPNPDEQNIRREAVCEHVAESKYASLYEAAWGEPINCSDDLVAIKAVDVIEESEFDISFKRIILAICAWQASKDNNSWSSKRDNALRDELACLAGDGNPAVCGNESYINSPGEFPLVGLTHQENLGHDLFYSVNFAGINRRFPDPAIEPNNCPDNVDDCLPVTQCAFCHSNSPRTDTGAELFQTYTDHAYHNIGTPANPELPAAPNPGISGFSATETGDGNASGHGQAAGEKGGFRAPTMRNVAKIPPTEPGDDVFIRNYTHNGWFKSLESLVHFYNSRVIGGATANGFGITACESVVTEKQALADNCWPEPEWPQTVSGSRLIGDLGLTPEQEVAIVAYLKALTDLETAVAPHPYKQERKKRDKRR